MSPLDTKNVSWCVSGALCIPLLFALGGCSKSGPNLAPVSGRVTLGGEPLEEVEVLFQPEGAASPSIGRTDKDGNYRLHYKRGVEGGTVGQNTVHLKTITEMTHGKQQIPER